MSLRRSLRINTKTSTDDSNVLMHRNWEHQYCQVTPSLLSMRFQDCWGLAVQRLSRHSSLHGVSVPSIHAGAAPTPHLQPHILAANIDVRVRQVLGVLHVVHAAEELSQPPARR